MKLSTPRAIACVVVLAALAEVARGCGFGGICGACGCGGIPCGRRKRAISQIDLLRDDFGDTEDPCPQIEWKQMILENLRPSAAASQDAITSAVAIAYSGESLQIHCVQEGSPIEDITDTVASSTPADLSNNTSNSISEAARSKFQTPTQTYCSARDSNVRCVIIGDKTN